MNLGVPILTLAISASLCSCAGSGTSRVKPPAPAIVHDPINGSTFAGLSEQAAAAKGTKLAESDFRKGDYRLLEVGLYMGPSRASKRLYRDYGVSGYGAAGCEVTSELLAGVHAYNEKMRDLLIQKHGEDIFKKSGYDS